MALPGVGDEFAGYLLEAELARGGMGVVFLARDVELDRRVALKLIRPDLSSDPAYRERFRTESRAAAAIEHPNVVGLYEARSLEGVLYLAMQYVAGPDLRTEIFERGRLEPRVAISIAEQVGAGLDAVHAAGLVHRDVKPANVLLANPGADVRALITDFGIARAEAATTKLTATGQFMGTLDYIAPEQMQGSRVDARADVYALGCVLYEMLTGSVPYPAADGRAKMYGHVRGEIPRIDPGLVAEAAALNPVIARALAKDPDGRFPSAGDLGRAARGALEGEAPTVPERIVGVGDAAPSAERAAGAPPTAGAPPAAPAASGAARLPAADDDAAARRRRRLLALGGLLAALLAGGIVLAVLGLLDGGAGSSRADPPTTTTTTTTTTSTEEPSTATTTTTVPPQDPAGGGGGAGSAGAELDAAVATVSEQGFQPTDTSTYDPSHTLSVLIGSQPGASAAPAQAFFFVDGQFVGTDASDPSQLVEVAYSTDTETALTYTLFDKKDAACCPSGGTATVRFTWNGSSLQPLDPIPPSDPEVNGSRR